MTTSSARPSSRQRWIVGLIGVLALVLTVTWMAHIYFIQLALIGGALALVLEVLFFAAVLRNGLRWLFSRRGLVFVAWVAAGLVSVVLLFYAEENWRGKRAWAAVLREAAARGDRVEFSSIIPPEVRDEDNLFRAPDVSNLLTSSNWDNLIGTPVRHWPVTCWAVDYYTDLSAWSRLLHGEERTRTQMTFPPKEPCGQEQATGVLEGLQQYEPLFQALRRAAERPGNRFDLDYRQGLFAMAGRPVNPYQQVAASAELLCVRASAQLVLNRTDTALEDMFLALRLANCLTREPFWEGHARRGPELMHLLQPIWEGLATHRWSDQQLISLQERLAELNLLADLRWRLRADALTMINLADQFEAWRARRPSPLGDRMAAETNGSDRFMGWLARNFYPTGWLYQDRAWIYRLYLKNVPADDSATQVWGSEPRWGGLLGEVTDPVLLVFVVPRMKELYVDGRRSTLFLTAAMRQAVIACALERYRLGNGKYPDTLQALSPGFLKQIPADPLATPGTPFHYLPAESGYDLYSIGLDLADDGGKRTPASLGAHDLPSLFPRVEHGDWVWRQPPAR